MRNADLVPTYLAEIFNRAIPNPVDANSPFQGFVTTNDNVALADSIATSSTSGPFTYGHCKYMTALYGH